VYPTTAITRAEIAIRFTLQFTDDRAVTCPSRLYYHGTRDPRESTHVQDQSSRTARSSSLRRSGRDSIPVDGSSAPSYFHGWSPDSKRFAYVTYEIASE
jgi:hypothetical protein